MYRHDVPFAIDTTDVTALIRHVFDQDTEALGHIQQYTDATPGPEWSSSASRPMS
jgi:hypothetical protein